MLDRKPIIYLIGAVGISAAAVLAATRFAHPPHIVPRNDLKIIAEGFEHYRLRHGEYPELPNFQAIVGPNSPLVLTDCIPVAMSIKDRQGHPYKGLSSKTTFQLEGSSDPADPNEPQGFVYVSGTRTQ